MSAGKYVIKTLGCKANWVDSQLLEAELQKRGWKPADSGRGSSARLCLVNSCTVTDEADRQSRRLAARLSREHPEAAVVVTGCSAEVDPERLARSRGIHYVVGNRDKPSLVDLVLRTVEERREAGPGVVLGRAEGYEEMRSRHPVDRDWPLPDLGWGEPAAGSASRTRAFLKIQEGCNAFCTYCVIPYGRGPSRSLGMDEVADRVGLLVEEGVREVVLTGTNIGDYGTDWSDQPRLEDLLERLLESTSIERVRLSSLDPVEISPRLTALVELAPRLMPHFHVSLQSASTRILRLMKRKYGLAQALECLSRIDRICRPDGPVHVGMDVITGFPGETDADFEAALAALASAPWTRLHVFPYSERARTPALRLPGALAPSMRAERAARLRELSLNRLRGSVEGLPGRLIRSVLVEGPTGEGHVAGHSPNYIRVLLPKGEARQNEVIDVRAERVAENARAGEIALVSARVGLGEPAGHRVVGPVGLDRAGV